MLLAINPADWMKHSVISDQLSAYTIEIAAIIGIIPLKCQEFKGRTLPQSSCFSGYFPAHHNLSKK
jgi:hypothetical protein